MRETMAKEIMELREMEVPELVASYEEVFGKLPQIKRREWLWRRIGYCASCRTWRSCHRRGPASPPRRRSSIHRRPLRRRYCVANLATRKERLGDFRYEIVDQVCEAGGDADRHRIFGRL